MQHILPRSDFLVSIVGTSVMPNILGTVLRLNKGGRVYLIHTEETETAAKNISRLLEAKYIDGIPINCSLSKLINYHNPREVYRELTNRLIAIREDIQKHGGPESLIELNYTGGTKVISAIAHILMKNLFIDKKDNLYLTYLDGEQSKVIINHCSKEYIINYSYEAGSFPLTVKDIADAHEEFNERYSNDFEWYDKEPEKFSKDIMNLIALDIHKRDRVISYLEDINNGLRVNVNKGDFLAFLNKLSEEQRLIEEYNSAEAYLRSFGIESEESLHKRDRARMTKIMRGLWLEEIVGSVMTELKDEGLIDDFIGNLYRYRDKFSNREMEIDFMAKKDFKLYFFSVSTVDDEEKSKFKLYEIKQRARMLAENEAAICVITLLEDKEELIINKAIWEDKLKNTLIIAWKDLPLLKSSISQWIINKGVDHG